MSTEERRAPGTTRTPFEAQVDVGGTRGPMFEAHAVNISEEGIALRTAYLPEPGQPLTCRFDAGPKDSILASGEVVWAQPAETGGEFGVRFTDVDAESLDALKRVCGLAGTGPQPGSKVRLHIEGLSSPMRAKIKDASGAAVTVGSDLGFLQVGRQLDVEDAQNGMKRPARIDSVDVAVDPTSHVPQLIVTLRYATTKKEGTLRGESDTAGAAAPSGAPTPLDRGTVEQAGGRVREMIEQGRERISPALAGLADRAKAAVVALLGNRRERHAETSHARRTTAPPPGGPLHMAGRRFVRGGPATASGDEPSAVPKAALKTRRIVLASGVMAAAILGAIALKRIHHETPVQNDGLAAASASQAAAQSAPPGASAIASASAAPSDSAVPPPAPPSTAAAEADDADSQKAHKKHARATPFGNGPVHHGNVLHLKMDGPVEVIEGAAQPTGFVVKTPGHKALEAAAPLAARDSRIAAIRVTNEPAGAELTVAFKDGVPNYRVSARGDTLVIALAPPGALEETVAKKDDSAGHGTKHRHMHDKKKTDQDL